jgi:hypothetical protein
MHLNSSALEALLMAEADEAVTHTYLSSCLSSAAFHFPAFPRGSRARLT